MSYSASLSLSAEELALRRPIWIAMSDLFLDTDVRIFYGSVAATAAASSFAFPALRRIYQEEVAPALVANLLTVAGEWAAFDEDWVVEQICGQGRIEALANRTIIRALHGKSIEEEWNGVELLARRLRTLPKEDWPLRQQAWNALYPLFVTDSHRQPGEVGQRLKELPLSAAQWHELFEQELRSAFGQSPQQQLPLAQVDQRWAIARRSLD